MQSIHVSLKRNLFLLFKNPDVKIISSKSKTCKNSLDMKSTHFHLPSVTLANCICEEQ